MADDIHRHQVFKAFRSQHRIQGRHLAGRPRKEYLSPVAQKRANFPIDKPDIRLHILGSRSFSKSALFSTTTCPKCALPSCATPTTAPPSSRTFSASTEKIPPLTSSTESFHRSHRRQAFWAIQRHRSDSQHFLSKGKLVRRLRIRHIFRNRRSDGKSPFHRASSKSHRGANIRTGSAGRTVRDGDRHRKNFFRSIGLINCFLKSLML